MLTAAAPVLSRYGVDRRTLLDALADAIIALPTAASITPRDAATCLHGLAAAGKLDARAFAVLAEVLVPATGRVPALQPHDVVQAAWAFSQLAAPGRGRPDAAAAALLATDAKGLRLLPSELGPDMPRLGPGATLGSSLDSITSAASSSSGSRHAQVGSGSGDAMTPAPGIGACGPARRGASIVAPARSPAAVLLALGRAAMHGPGGGLAQYKDFALAGLASALARGGARDSAVLRALADASMPWLAAAEPRVLTSLAWGLARLGVEYDGEWWGRLAAAARQLLPSCNEADLANLAHALAMARHRDEGSSLPTLTVCLLCVCNVLTCCYRC
jgi:hypothetical protein